MSYSDEQVEYMKSEYLAEPTRATIERIAQELGVGHRSIIGKLVSMKVYKKPERIRKDGKPVELKKDLAAEIGELFGLELPSLMKAEREDLRLLRDAILNEDNLKAIIVDIQNG